MPPSAKQVVIAVVVALIVGLAAYVVYESAGGPGPVTTGTPYAFFVNGKSYAFTYVATTPQERQEGLMNKRVTNTTIELFAFPTAGRWQFWMYDTNTSLDMIWVNGTGSTGRVVYVVTSAQPCYTSGDCTIYTPSAPANYVIEAKAGFAAENGISVGTGIQFTFQLAP